MMQRLRRLYVSLQTSPFITWLRAPLSVVALSLAAIRPWFRLESVCSDDLSFHLLRLAQLQALVHRGILYSRWAPDMALGYGYPFFNFYAPLSYYVALALSVVTPNLKIALITTFALATLAAGLTAYLLARDTFSPRSALVAAMAYAYAPYLAYDAYFRANLAETMAWSLLPLALWAMGRLARESGRIKYIITVSLSYAAILLTHNAFALIFSPLLAAYGLVTVVAFASDRTERYRRLTLAGTAILLGLALSAFFWLPALVERAYVHSDRLLVPPVFVYWNNFIGLRELLAAPPAIRPDLLNPSPPRALGLVPVLLALTALIGLFGLYRRRARTDNAHRRRYVAILFFTVALLGYAWLTTASSRIVWDHIPLLEYVQFPWRLLGAAALCLAMLIGGSVELLLPYRHGLLVTGVFTLLLVLSSLFWHDPRYCPGLEDPSAADIALFERDSHTVGTTAKGEYLPRTVKQMPAEQAKFLLDNLPASTTFSGQRMRGSFFRPAIGAELTITATQPFTAVYNAFYYPGWQVKVSGERTPITPDKPHGRITFPIPQGTHHVTIRFGETPLRRWANGISLLGLVALLMVALYPKSIDTPIGPSPSPGNPPSLGWAMWGLALLGVTMLLPHLNTPLHRSALENGTLPNLEMTTNTSFEDGLTLLGFNQTNTTVPSGSDDPGRLDLFWTVWQKPSHHYHRVIEITGPNGLRWDRGDAIPPRDFREPPPTHTWETDRYVQDSHIIATVHGTPPGTYDLALVVFHRKTRVPARTLNDDGQPGPPSLPLGQLTVTRPQRPPTPDEMTLERRLDLVLGPLTLLDAQFDRAEAAPGDPFLVSFYWLADERPRVDLIARLLLLDSVGNVAATFDTPPTRESHPTSTWQPGDLWLGQHAFHLPANLKDGDYAWRLQLYPSDADPADSPRLTADLPDTLHITASPHTFTPPPVDLTLDVPLGAVATLTGALFDPPLATGDSIGSLEPGQSLTVTLVWRAEADNTRPIETHTSYRVFLHMIRVGQNGAPVAQSDAIPANWARPTTGWISQEYIIDPHALSIPADTPPGTYTLQAGLYDPDGTRLTTPDGTDSISLVTITMQSP